ncbi:MAG TPA: MFS transporter [Longimicrobium sp.]|jgi:MFS family permease
MEEAAEKASLRGAVREMRAFLVIWVGQLVSELGSGLTGFAIPVWVYQQTGSAEQFGLLMFAQIVPALLVSPFAGALVDRWDRRKVLIASDTASALVTLAVAALVFTGRFEVWHLFVIGVFGSLIGPFQDPAFAASISVLVPRRHYGRAVGMMQTAGSLSAILTPVLAGVLVVTVGLGWVVLIDLATYLVAIGTLAFARIPSPPQGPEHRHDPLAAQAAYGWRFVRERRGLLGLLLFFAFTNFLGGFLGPLMQPMVLAITTPAVLGTLVSMMGVGGLLGAMAMSVWGGPKRRVRGVLAFCALGGLCTVVVGLKPWLPLIAAGLFASALAWPLLQGTHSALWFAKTPAEAVGRVIAIRRMVVISSAPLSVLLAGPLAERVFEPLLMPGGALAPTVGAVLGVGKGRGIALMFVLVGLLTVLAAAVVYAVPAIRHVERDVPDAPPVHPEPAPPPAPADEAERGEAVAAV